MNKKLYMAFAGVLSLMALGCSDSNVSGSSEDPNVLTALGSSSSFFDDFSSSSVWFSSDGRPRLCRVSEMELAPADCDWFGEMWNSESGNRVHTGFDNGSNTSGIWYWNLDSGEVLLPRIDWPAEVNGNYDSLSLSKVIETCKGSVCGTAGFYIDGDSTGYYNYETGVVPSVSVAFAMAGKNASGKFDEVDASALNGLCVSYSLGGFAFLILDFGDSVNALMGDAAYATLLMRSDQNENKAMVTEREECFAWSDFKADYGRKGLVMKDSDRAPSISVEEAVKHLVGVRFVIRGYYNGTKNPFEIIRIGKFANAGGRRVLDDENYPVVDESCVSPVVVSNFCECDYADPIAEQEGFSVAYNVAIQEVNGKWSEQERSSNLCLMSLWLTSVTEAALERPGSQPCDNPLPKVLQCSDGSFRSSTDFMQVKSAYDEIVREKAAVSKQTLMRKADSCMMVSSSSANLNSSSSFFLTTPPTAKMYSDDLWEGYSTYVDAGMYVEDKSLVGVDVGKWFWETDSAFGGKSFIEWPVELGDEYDSLSIDPVIDYCIGLCGTFHLDRGDLSYNPYVDVGFNVAGFEDFGKELLSADITNWNGICVSYSASVAPTLVLDLGDSLNEKLAWALPMVDLAKTSFGTNKCFEWSDFKMPSWASAHEFKITGEEAAKHVARIYFRFQSASGVGNFNIMAIGSNRQKKY